MGEKETKKLTKGKIDLSRKGVRPCDVQTLKGVLQTRNNCGGSPPCIEENQRSTFSWI